jgi:hypothetical protein
MVLLMKTYGIRISDCESNVLSVKLSDLLEEISNGAIFYWSVLFLDGIPNTGEGKFINEYKNKINKSMNGLMLDWNEICFINAKLFQIYEITILGCKKQKFLHRYYNDQEMYESCDIVIELIDCAFWQIFSKDSKLIRRINKKFKEVELLESNFKK